MSEQTKQILVNDFSLFADVMKSATKIVDSAKFIINENGLSIYGARGKIARCELVTNSIYSQTPVEFSILDLNMFVKILGTIKEIHEDDYSDFKFVIDGSFIKFSSKKFKTKLTTCNEDVISKWVSKKIEAQLVPVFEFKTTGDLIRRINSHQFIFSDPNNLRVYLETKQDMENNAVFATVGNKENNLNNELTLKLGLVTSGKIPDGRNLVLDLERLNLFNAFPSDSITISLMNMNVLVSKTNVAGKNNSYFSLSIYNTILKA